MQKRGRNCLLRVTAQLLSSSLGLDLGGGAAWAGGNLGGAVAHSETGARIEPPPWAQDGGRHREGERLAGTSLGVPALHDLDLDTENTLLQRT